MTTQVSIRNHATSNGDVILTRRAPTHITREAICPGDKLTVMVSGNENLELTELWPQLSPPASQTARHKECVMADVTGEADVQLKMWGEDRADNKNDELIAAALTTVLAVRNARNGTKRETAFKLASDVYYPRNWSPDAFRDYGSDYANLAVAAAYLINQMLIMRNKGEATNRSQRAVPYTSANPAVSAIEAGAAR